MMETLVKNANLHCVPYYNRMHVYSYMTKVCARNIITNFERIISDFEFKSKFFFVIPAFKCNISFISVHCYIKIDIHINVYN